MPVRGFYGGKLRRRYTAELVSVRISDRMFRLGDFGLPGDPGALALLDPSTPPVATIGTGAGPVVSLPFTPPAGALLLIQWCGDSDSGLNPAQPTITDSLGTHLTYPLLDWQSRADSPAVSGQAAQWWARVGASATMTISVTSGSITATAGALRVRVFTGDGGIGVHGKAGSASAASIAQSYTALVTGGWGFLANTDWDVKGPQSAGTGCAIDVGDSATIGSQITFGFVRRHFADDVAGAINTLNVTIPATSANLSWVYAEVLPYAIPWTPPRYVPVRDPGETWWLQDDRRDTAILVSAPAAPDIPTANPVDIAAYAERRLAPQQRAYFDLSLLAPPAAADIPAANGVDIAAYADRRSVPAQRQYVSDPNLLATAELENELLGNADAPKRYLAPATHAPRWWMPRQLKRDGTTPGLLDSAELENELLGGSQTTVRSEVAATHADRRGVPAQRLYFDSSLLATAELEGNLLGGADTARHGHAAEYVDRRQTVAQRSYTSDPSLLTPVVVLDPTTAAWPGTWQAYNAASLRVDRRETVAQRPYLSDPSFYPSGAVTDPLTLAYGAGGTYWLLYNTAALAVDRRLSPQQRRYMSEPALLASALLENELLGGTDDRARRYGSAAYYDRRVAGQQRIYFGPPSTALLEDVLLGQGDVARHATWFTDRRVAGQQRVYLGPPSTALLELVLLGGADDRQRHLAWFADRRTVAAQPNRYDPNLLAAFVADPLTLAAGVGGDLWRRYNLSPYLDRRLAPQQPPRVTLYFDAGPGSPPLTLAWGAGGSLWHTYNWRRPARDRWPWWFIYTPTVIANVNADSTPTVSGRASSVLLVSGPANASSVTAARTGSSSVSAKATSVDPVTANRTSEGEVT